MLPKRIPAVHYNTKCHVLLEQSILTHHHLPIIQTNGVCVQKCIGKRFLKERVSCWVSTTPDTEVKEMRAHCLVKVDTDDGASFYLASQVIDSLREEQLLVDAVVLK